MCQYLPFMSLLLAMCQPTNLFVYLYQCHENFFHFTVSVCIANGQGIEWWGGDWVLVLGTPSCLTQPPTT